MARGTEGVDYPTLEERRGEGFAPNSPAVISLLTEFIVSPAVLVFFVALSLDASSLSIGASGFGFVVLIGCRRRQEKNEHTHTKPSLCLLKGGKLTKFKTRVWYFPPSGSQAHPRGASGLTASTKPKLFCFKKGSKQACWQRSGVCNGLSSLEPLVFVQTMLQMNCPRYLPLSLPRLGRAPRVGCGT